MQTIDTIRWASPTDDLGQIARAIYQTDPYIYPAAFGRDGSGLSAMAKMIGYEEGVFSYKNILLAIAGDRILGQAVMLSEKTSYHFDYHGFFFDNPELPKSFIDVADSYFSSLQQHQDKDTDYLACFSVDADHRGRGIGSLILCEIEKQTHKAIRLHVLADNQNAIQLYESHGFRIIGSAADGYAYAEKPPKCYEMLRTI